MTQASASRRDEFLRLGRQRYVALTTFRRNGDPVATPVWIARDGDRLVVWTARSAGKVRRIRANRHVTVAPSDLRGRPLGEAMDAVATVLPDERLGEVFAALGRSYPVQFRLLRAYEVVSAVLRGRSAASTRESAVAIELRIDLTAE